MEDNSKYQNGTYKATTGMGSVVVLRNLFFFSTIQTEHNYGERICVADRGERGTVIITVPALNKKK